MKIVVVVLSKYSRNGNRIFCWTLRNPFTFRQVNDLRTLALLDRLTSELSIDAFAAFVPISAHLYFHIFTIGSFLLHALMMMMVLQMVQPR